MDLPRLPENLPGSAASPDDPLLLGRFRIERELGRGGMGEVLLARDLLLNRRVALKRLCPDAEHRDESRAAILREARRASQINDARIAAIHDVLEFEGELLLVMEYVDGVTLRERMVEPIALEEFWELAIPCAEAVACAHAHGLIHRDIKPENLMVTRDGAIKILDFGIAKRATPLEGDTGATTFTDTSPERTAGTPHYMSPEAHLGESVDPRSDVFSLGVVFHELLTGKRPFSGSNYASVLYQVLNATAPPVTDANPAAGPWLSRIVARMLAKDPADRYASAAEVARELAQARTATGEPPPPAVAPILPPRPMRRWLAVTLPLAAIAAAVVLWRVLPGAFPMLPRDRVLAVLAPTTPSADDDFASFALGAVDLLSDRLQRSTTAPGFQMASFGDGFKERVRSAVDARQVLGANLALLSTLERHPDVLRARLVLAETERGRTIASRTIQVAASEPHALFDRMYREALAMAGLPRRSNDPAADLGVRGEGTVRFYFQGIGRLRAGSTEADARRAAQDFDLACRTEPDAAVARAGLASALLAAHQRSSGPQDLADAETAAREAIARADQRPEGHRALARVFATEKNSQASLIELARLCELTPTDDDMYSLYGRTYGRLGQPERERDVYAAAIQQRPHCWQPRWWLATWYFRAGQIDSSIRVYQEMIDRAPLLHLGYSNMGGLLVLRGDYPAAIRSLTRSVTLHPTKGAFDNLGTAYFNSGRFAEAIDAYNRSFQFGEADYESWINLGDAYFWLRNRQDAAVGAYAQAIRLGRAELLARSREGRTVYATIPADLATVFPKLSQPDSARVYLARALSLDSTDYRVAYSAALTYWQLEDRTRAISWLEKSVHAGYPAVWLRDSPIFLEWRREPAFMTLIANADPKR